MIKLHEYKWHECYISWKGWDYSIAELIKHAESIKAIECPIEAIDMTYNAPNDNNILSFVEHMKRVLAANIRYPLLLAPDGFLLDGRHRLAKLVMNNASTVKIKRLHDMPAAYRKTKDD